MRIDIHTHCDTTDSEEVRQFVEMCQQHQTQACLFSVGPRSGHSFCANEKVLSVARQYHEVLIPFTFLDLWDSIDDINLSALREAGFKGFKCASPYYSYDHDLYMPIYEKAQNLRMPIIFHTGRYRPDSGDRIRQRPVLRNMQPLTLDRVARSFPELKIVVAHLGTSLFRHEAADLLKLHSNMYADLAGSGSWKALSPADLALLLKPPLPGTGSEFRYFEKLLLGSDAYTSMPHLIEQAQHGYENLLADIGVPQSIQDNIMGKTVNSWISANP